MICDPAVGSQQLGFNCTAARALTLKPLNVTDGQILWTYPMLTTVCNNLTIVLDDFVQGPRLSLPALQAVGGCLRIVGGGNASLLAIDLPMLTEISCIEIESTAADGATLRLPLFFASQSALRIQDSLTITSTRGGILNLTLVIDHCLQIGSHFSGTAVEVRGRLTSNRFLVNHCPHATCNATMSKSEFEKQLSDLDKHLSAADVGHKSCCYSFC